MKRCWMLIVMIIAVTLSSCRDKQISPTEEVMKSEILAWWGARIFEDVVIEDTVRVKKTYEVYARMVVCFDTLEQMKYAFKKYRRGWRVWNGPVDEKTKSKMIQEMLEIPLNTAKNNIIMANMRELQRALMQFVIENDGRFPANFDVKQYPMSLSVRELLGEHMKNPYIPGAPAVTMALGDTSEWFPEYEGKVIYFPLDVDFEEVFASGFIVKGSSNTRFLKHAVNSDNLY
ncbi:MAG: hypothetical protein E3J87_10135 [Candidatus Cloacimonadota bacterium]|nr:MAG: hypothetical protein E3J87_10135 [Candidatus Cloacimonadota bacterium]